MLSSIPLRTLARQRIFLGQKRPTLLSKTSRRKSFSSSSDKTTKEAATAANNPRERAQQLHHEIENIVQKHDKRHEEDLKKGKSMAGFTEFLSKNKTNISVIVVSFLTVILSVKMVQNKQKYKELEQELLQTKEQVDQKRKILRSMTDESFLQNVSRQCAKELQQQRNSKQSKWGLSVSNASSIQMATTSISSVLQQELDKIIGDEGLTHDEQSVKKFKDLQQGRSSSSSSSSSSATTDDKLSGLLAEQSKASEAEAEEESMVLVEDAQGKKIVKKSVFRI